MGSPVVVGSASWVEWELVGPRGGIVPTATHSIYTHHMYCILSGVGGLYTYLYIYLLGLYDLLDIRGIRV